MVLGFRFQASIQFCLARLRPTRYFFIGRIQRFQRAFQLLHRFIRERDATTRDLFGYVLFNFRIDCLLLRLFGLTFFLGERTPFLIRARLYHLILLDLNNFFLFLLFLVSFHVFPITVLYVITKGITSIPLSIRRWRVICRLIRRVAIITRRRRTSFRVLRVLLRRVRHRGVRIVNQLVRRRGIKVTRRSHARMRTATFSPARLMSVTILYLKDG